MNHITFEQKAQLKKVKTPHSKVKEAVYAGCQNPGASMQFGEDLKLYGLYEAILYVEGYERDGYYTVGTAQKAMEIAIEKHCK